MACYTAFGFIVDSDLVLPELNSAVGIPDVWIKKREIVNTDQWAEIKGIKTTVVDQNIKVEIADILILEIIEGKYIHYQPKTSFVEGKARMYILGLAFAAIIHQRGFLPLHASAVMKGGKAILICGNSGAGKSTTAAALLKRGFTLLSDDISLIKIDNDGVARVLPGFPQMKLWPESAELLGVEVEELNEFAPDVLKKGWRLDLNQNSNPIEIEGVCHLFKLDNKPLAYVIQGVDKFKVLIDNTFRLRYVNDTNNHQAYFETTSKLASTVKMIAIHRPEKVKSLSKVVSLLLSYFKL